MNITNIRTRRMKLKLSEKEAMEQLQISKSTFSKLEQGRYKPSSDLVIQLSKVYRCTTDEIFKDLDML